MTLVNAINLKTGDVAEFDLINIKTSGNYKGLWDASTNTPFLTNGVGTEGDWYEVSVGGTVNFGAGDFVFSEGDTVSYIEGKWEKASEKIIDDSQINYNKTWSSAKIKEEIDIQVPLIVEEKLEAGLAGKQDLLTEDQLKAVNSGITAEKVADYDGLSTDINNLSTEVATNKTDIATLKTDMGDIGDSITDLRNDKQDKLTETQLQAVDSGITSEKVLGYDTAVSELAELKQEVTDIDGMVAENGAEINALKTGKNDVFQVLTVPLLTDVVPNPFQYTGETEGGFIKGHFYEKTETDFTQWERADNQTYVVTMADAVVGDGVYQADGKTVIGTITEISDDAMTYTDTDGQSVSTTYHSVFHSTGYEEVYDFKGSNIASDIIYDNATSGLTADNVQSAIDELSSNKFNNTTDISNAGKSVIVDSVGNLVFGEGTGTGTVYSNAPIGTVLSYAGNTIPNGYLLCDGSNVSRTDYSDLFEVIGTTYGAGDGSTTFTLPNLIDKFIQGSSISGTEKEAGVPNIEGIFGNRTGVSTDTILAVCSPNAVLEGALYKRTVNGSVNINGKSEQLYTNAGGLGFDASLSNSIYGNSDTVQPPALTMVYIIKALFTGSGEEELVKTIPLTLEDGSIENKKLYLGIENKVEALQTTPSAFIPLVLRDTSTVATVVLDWLTELGETITSTEVTLKTWSVENLGTTAVYTINLKYVYLDDTYSELMFEVLDGDNSLVNEVVFCCFEKGTDTLTYEPKYATSFMIQTSMTGVSLLPETFIDDCKNIITIFDVPHIEGIDKYKQYFGNLTKFIEEVNNDNSLVKLYSNAGTSYLKLVLGPGNHLYLGYNGDSLVAYRNKSGFLSGPFSSVDTTTNLIPTPNSTEVYTGDFSVDFASGSSTTSLGSTGSKINFYRVNSSATNQPNGASQGVMIVKSIGTALGTTIFGTAIAIYYSDTGIHYMFGKGFHYPSSVWSGTWLSLTIS